MDDVIWVHMQNANRVTSQMTLDHPIQKCIVESVSQSTHATRINLQNIAFSSTTTFLSITRLSAVQIMAPTGQVLLAPSPAEGKAYDFMYYLKGAAAGGICCSITHGALTPVDVVKTRVQLDPVKVGCELKSTETYSVAVLLLFISFCNSW